MTGAQEVLDAIDRALDDRSVSDDAMRWTPDRRGEAARRRIEAREQIRRNVSITVPPLLAPEEVARAVERLARTAEQFTELREALRPAFETFARTVEEFGGSLAKAVEAIRPALFDNSRIPPPPRTLRDTDPRAYALELRRTRNTGPDRQVQHRPPPRRVR